MVAFAREEFERKSELAAGLGSVDAHLRQAAKTLKVDVDELAPKSSDLPGEGLYLWLFFTELHAARGSGGFGPGAITYEAIQAWSALTGTPLHPWEVRVIKEMDRAFLGVVADQQAKGRKPQQQE